MFTGEEMKTTFIYALKELKPGEYFSTKIRYVGKSDDPYKRFEQHIRTQEKGYRGNWIRSLLASGLSLQLEIIDEVSQNEWPFWEKEYIRAFKAIGFTLVNETDGGEGVCNFGKKKSAAHRRNISLAKTGKKLSPQHCDNISRARIGLIKGDKHPMFGKKGNRHPAFGRKHSEAELQKMRASMLGRNRPEFLGEKNPFFGKKHSESSILKSKISKSFGRLIKLCIPLE